MRLGFTGEAAEQLGAFAVGPMADRYGRKIMVERSLVSFIVVMAALYFVFARPHTVPGRRPM